MLYQYSHKIEIRGRVIHVPSLEGKANGTNIIRHVLRLWAPPRYFYHLQPGGHVAAIKSHLGHRYFLRLDIEDFFGSVTRTKVDRSLKAIGIKQIKAWHYAQVSTVPSNSRPPRYSLPFGFRQSPILASLALERSHVGKTLEDAVNSGFCATVYMDDIVCSGDDYSSLLMFRARLEDAAACSGFRLSASKTTGPCTSIEVFNLAVSHLRLRLTEQRLRELEETEARGDPSSASAIRHYINSVTV